MSNAAITGKQRAAEAAEKSAVPVWRALYVSSRSEKKVMETLQGRTLESYVPLVKTLRQWSDRKKLVEMPLLSGYVFVRVTASQHDRVTTTRGVVSFVRSEGKIAKVRDEEIARLKQLVELGYQAEASAIGKVYRTGEKVKITSGPLRGIDGYVTQAGDQKLLEILLESIGQCVRVKLPAGMVVGVH